MPAGSRAGGPSVPLQRQLCWHHAGQSHEVPKTEFERQKEHLLSKFNVVHLVLNLYAHYSVVYRQKIRPLRPYSPLSWRSSLRNVWFGNKIYCI